ncbi:MAG: methyltransferase domain-containing protein [Planctomycetota bacterium]
MTTHRDYVLGTDASEAERLGIQHRLWSDTAFAAWHRAGVRLGSSVLDLGSGPGWTSIDLAQLVGPAGRVVGVEGSPPYAAEHRDRAAAMGLKNTTIIEGDLHELSSLLGDHANDAFDVVYTRWVPCFLRDAESVIAQAARALKPGGRIAIQDYFGYETMRIVPRSPAFELIARAAGESIDETGDTQVMGKMPGYLRAAGLEVERYEPIQKAARPSEPIWDWPAIFWPNFVPRLVEAGRITQATADEFAEDWRRATENPDAVMMLPPVFEAIARKPIDTPTA